MTTLATAYPLPWRLPADEWRRSIAMQLGAVAMVLVLGVIIPLVDVPKQIRAVRDAVAMTRITLAPPVPKPVPPHHSCNKCRSPMCDRSPSIHRPRKPPVCCRVPSRLRNPPRSVRRWTEPPMPGWQRWKMHSPTCGLRTHERCVRPRLLPHRPSGRRVQIVPCSAQTRVAGRWRWMRHPAPWAMWRLRVARRHA